MKKLLLFVLSFCFLFQSCMTDNQQDDDEYVTICVDDIKTKEVNLSELVRSHELVQLAGTTEALLNYPNQIAVSKDFILITDFMNYPAKLFNVDGTFVNNMGTIGKGPGEYLTLISPYIDVKNNEFWLMRGGNFTHPKDYWIIVLDQKGKVVREIDANPLKGNFRNSNPVLINNSELFLPGNIGAENLMSYYSLENKEIVNIPSKIPKDYFLYTSGSECYPGDDGYVFKIGESDTVYRFQPASKEIFKELVIYTSKHRFNADAIRKARSGDGPNRFQNIVSAAEGGYSIGLGGETQDYYIFFITIHGGSNDKKLVLVDKKYQTAYFVNLINDFHDGQFVDPKTIRFYNNEYLIVHIPQVEKSDQNDVLHICMLKK